MHGCVVWSYPTFPVIFREHSAKTILSCLRLAFKPTVAKHWQISSFLCPKCTVFLCIQLFWERLSGKSARENPERYCGWLSGKSARENPERYCGWFWVRCSSEFQRMAREAMDGVFSSAKANKATKVGSTATALITVYWSCPILPFGIVACTYFPTAFLEIP